MWNKPVKANACSCCGNPAKDIYLDNKSKALHDKCLLCFALFDGGTFQSVSRFNLTTKGYIKMIEAKLVNHEVRKRLGKKYEWHMTCHLYLSHIKQFDEGIRQIRDSGKSLSKEMELDLLKTLVEEPWKYDNDNWNDYKDYR